MPVSRNLSVRDSCKDRHGGEGLTQASLNLGEANSHPQNVEVFTYSKDACIESSFFKRRVPEIPKGFICIPEKIDRVTSASRAPHITTFHAGPRSSQS